MSEDESFLKQIESDEIKKLIDIIYDSKPEDSVKESKEIDKHSEIAKHLDNFETPKKGFWKKRRKIF